MHRLPILGLLLASCIAVVPAATLITFDAPGSGTGENFGTRGIAINNQGVVAGYVNNSSGSLGFVRAADGTIVEFDADGHAETFVTAINGAGSVSGYAGNSGFIRVSSGSIELFASPAGVSRPIVPLSINNFGVLTGYWRDTQNVTHGFTRTAAGVVTSFDAPSAQGPNAYPTGINDSGEIVGQVVESDCICGFLLSGSGQFTFFTTGSSNEMFPLAINDSGRVTGYWQNVNGLNEAFVRSPSGVLTTFAGNSVDVSAVSFAINASGATTGFLGAGAFIRSASGKIAVLDQVNAINGTPVSINNASAVTGYYYAPPAGDYHGFVLIP